MIQPIAVLALLWSVLGCAAYLSDVRLTAEDVATKAAAEAGPTVLFVQCLVLVIAVVLVMLHSHAVKRGWVA